MNLSLMEAVVMDKLTFINTVNTRFRQWAKEHGATSGLGMPLPSPKSNGVVYGRQQVMESNLHLFDQTFECCCGFQTHIAGLFWEHCQFGCPQIRMIRNSRYGKLTDADYKRYEDFCKGETNGTDE